MLNNTLILFIILSALSTLCNGSNCVYTLAPIIIILLFILAAAGLNRGLNMFNMFGIGALLGMGTGVGKGSSGKGLRAASALQRRKMKASVRSVVPVKNLSGKGKKFAQNRLNKRINKLIQKGRYGKAQKLINKKINQQQKAMKGGILTPLIEPVSKKLTTPLSNKLLSVPAISTVFGKYEGKKETTPTPPHAMESTKNTPPIAPPHAMESTKNTPPIAPPHAMESTKSTPSITSPPVMESTKKTVLEVHKKVINNVFEELKSGNINEETKALYLNYLSSINKAIGGGEMTKNYEGKTQNDKDIINKWLETHPENNKPKTFGEKAKSTAIDTANFVFMDVTGFSGVPKLYKFYKDHKNKRNQEPKSPPKMEKNEEKKGTDKYNSFIEMQNKKKEEYNNENESEELRVEGGPE
ncbi:MAG: hypothetical protein ACP5T6_01350 [Candidatus Micrarchaeia archaeon]